VILKNLCAQADHIGDIAELMGEFLEELPGRLVLQSIRKLPPGVPGMGSLPAFRTDPALAMKDRRERPCERSCLAAAP
jgi:hypothetical protein